MEGQTALLYAGENVVAARVVYQDWQGAWKDWQGLARYARYRGGVAPQMAELLDGWCCARRWRGAGFSYSIWEFWFSPKQDSGPFKVVDRSSRTRRVQRGTVRASSTSHTRVELQPPPLTPSHRSASHHSSSQSRSFPAHARPVGIVPSSLSRGHPREHLSGVPKQQTEYCVPEAASSTPPLIAPSPRCPRLPSPAFACLRLPSPSPRHAVSPHPLIINCPLPSHSSKAHLPNLRH